MGFEVGTTALREDGTTCRMGDLQVGDLLQNGFNDPIRVVAVSQPYEVDSYMEISHRAFWGASEEPGQVIRFVTNDQQLAIQVNAVPGVWDTWSQRPQRNGNPKVHWYSHCNMMPYGSCPPNADARIAIGPGMNLVAWPLDPPAGSLRDWLPELAARAVEGNMRVREESDDCGKIREHTITASNPAHIRAITTLLADDQTAALVDPRVVRQGDMITLLPSQLKGPKHFDSRKKQMLRLCRPPLIGTPENGLELDEPYAIGAWFGDGTTGRCEINTSDAEIKAYWETMTDRMNLLQPDGCPHLACTSKKMWEPGMSIPGLSNAAMTTKDTYRVRIAFPHDSGYAAFPHRRNPLKEDLQRLGVLSCKTNGLPDWVYGIPVKQRLQMLAGFIDTDGYRERTNRSYNLKQCLANFNIIRDMRKMALSIPIRCSPIYVRPERQADGNMMTTCSFRILGRRMADISPHILIEDKKYDTSKPIRTQAEDSLTPMVVEKRGAGKLFVDVCVEGQFFQQGDGVLARDSSPL